MEVTATIPSEQPCLFDDIASPLIDALLRQAPVGITIASAPDVEILRVSDFGSQLLGRSKERLEHIAAVQHVEAYQVYDPVTRELTTPERLPLTRATTDGETVRSEEWLVGTEDGHLVPILCNAGPIRDSTGTIIGGVIAWADLSQQKKLEEKLRAAIAERDLAQRELFHRVKNHLSLVSSMVKIEAHGRGDAAEELARLVSAKISALGKAYAVLENEYLDAAPAADLLNAVAIPLASCTVGVEVTTEAGLFIPEAQCAPIAIILNEAICNALKHGYPIGKSGRITVSMKSTSDCLELVIANDGLPLSTDQHPTGRGTTFITNLVEQLDGTVSLENTDPIGVAMTIRIKRSAARTTDT